MSSTRSSTTSSDAKDNPALTQEPTPTATTAEVPPRDPAASMALIFDAMRHPVDPLYADAARRRAETGQSSAPHRSLLLVVACILLGLLFGTAAQTLREPKGVAHDRRAALIRQIQDKQTQNDKDTTTLQDLRKEISASQNSALQRSDSGGLKSRLASADSVAGTTVTNGKGLTMTLANPTSSDTDDADSDPRTEDEVDTITSGDLQQIVNSLWAAGATGIAINDQRVTSLSAIRFAGSAILVNFRPLATPYRITAIGPASMHHTFDAGYGGQYVAGMRRSGFTVTTTDASALSLPALPSVRLTHASTMAP